MTTQNRPSTPPRQNPNGSRTITVKRCCNGCGHELGDANQTELDAAMVGQDPPDVRSECPNCQPAPLPHEAAGPAPEPMKPVEEPVYWPTATAAQLRAELAARTVERDKARELAARREEQIGRQHRSLVEAEAKGETTAAQLATVRETLAVVSRERDRAHLLLRVVRRLGLLPAGPLERAVNGATALESEGDIEDALRSVDAWIRLHGVGAASGVSA